MIDVTARIVRGKIAHCSACGNACRIVVRLVPRATIANLLRVAPLTTLCRRCAHRIRTAYAAAFERGRARPTTKKRTR